MEAGHTWSDGRLDGGNRFEDPDSTLLHTLRSDARGGFEPIVRKYLAQVVRLARRFGLTADEAEDVAQEVFLRVWRGLPRFRGDARLRSWILRIAIRESSRQLARRKGFFVSLSDVPDEAALERDGSPDRAIRREQCARLRKALLGLSGKHREVLVLHCLEEF